MVPRRPPEQDTDELELGAVGRVNPQRVAVGKRGVCASAHFRASEAGAALLSAGGNAMDAACAAAFALGVCEPAASGLGGQTMMLIRDAKAPRTLALDGSSHAPHRVPPGGLERAERLHGHRATTVPSTPATLAYALRTYGTKSLEQVLEPAIDLAENGYEVSQLNHRLTRRELEHLRAGTAAPLFLKDGRRPYAVGSTFKQPALASTLRRLASHGVEDFYTGEIAQAIAADMEAHGGLIHPDDLAQIPWPIERKTVRGNLGELRVHTMPPPGAGRTLLEMLNIVSAYGSKELLLDTPRGALLLAEAIRRAFIDRRDRPFDPNYYPQVDDRRALSPDYAQLVAKQALKRFERGGETTHLSVMDADGNVVALTQSIERVYGSCAASPELGFLYNNYISAFDFSDISHPYYLRPAAVPWASVAPTIVFRKRKPWLAIGSPGSQRITSSILQVLLRLAHQSPLDAVSAPRLHCSIDGRVSLEASRMRDDIPPFLQRYGFRIDERSPLSFYLGCVQLAMRDGDVLIGVADPRRDGSAAGVST
ncbi:MAG: gamma-glutamyltransferase [Myxococcales bacterium]|nr:gamma-glutamyltransferase [Myxococcales bacterium]